MINRLWVIPDPVKIDEASSMKKNQLGELQPIVNCDKKDTSVQAGDILSQVSQTHDDFRQNNILFGDATSCS